MLSLLITSTNDDVNIFECHQNILKEAQIYDKDVNVLFLTTEADKHLKSFVQIATTNQNHLLLVADYKTSEDELTFMGLDIAKNTDTILLSINTKPEIITSLIEKKNKDFQIIRVRKTADFFSRMGIWAYNFGLRLFGQKNYDTFSEPKVQYFDGRIVNSLSKTVANNKEARVTNCFKNVRNGLVEDKQIFLTSQKQTVWNMFSYGILTSIYLTILLALLLIYPIFNNMFYSWWMVVAIVIWLGFGLLASLLISKKIFTRRIGFLNRADVNDEPLFDALCCIGFGDEFDFSLFDEPQESKLSEKVEEIKTPLKKAKTKNIKSAKKLESFKKLN